jgi:regulator of protease activity HflC (stomatin/prohibitin superfamily)
MIDILLLIGIPLFIWQFGYCRVRMGHVAVLERAGGFFKLLRPGMQFFVPLLQKVRSVNWSNSTMTLKGYNIPTNKQRFISNTVRLISPDGNKISAGFTVVFSIDNVSKAVYQTGDALQHLEDVCYSELRTVIQKTTNFHKVAEQFSAVTLNEQLTEIGLQVHSVSVTQLATAKHERPKVTNELAAQREHVVELRKALDCTVPELAAVLSALNSS